MNTLFENPTNLFQTSLYFYSSLIQADAAILGFGAIFLIFKLQALDNLKQNIIQSYNARGGEHIKNVNSLLFPDPQEVARILLFMDPEGKDYANYLHVLLIPKNINEINNLIKGPVILIGSHIILCSILLLTSQITYNNIILQLSTIALSLLGFGILIFRSSRIAINLPSRKVNLDLESQSPIIFEAIKRMETELLLSISSH
jgi:hypothetical protein